MKRKEYVSQKTGEVVDGFLGVIKAEYLNLRYHHSLDLSWEPFI